MISLSFIGCGNSGDIGDTQVWDIYSDDYISIKYPEGWEWEETVESLAETELFFCQNPDETRDKE